MFGRTQAALAVALLGLCALAVLGSSAGGCGSSDDAKDGGNPNGDAKAPDGGGTSDADQEGGPQPDQGVTASEFGRACDANTNPCSTPLICLTLPGATKGFCSKQCTNQGVPCDGSPPGTVAYCIAKDPVADTLACAFVCAHPQLGNQKCPPGLECPEKDNPPGSGQKLCSPP